MVGTSPARGRQGRIKLHFVRIRERGGDGPAPVEWGAHDRDKPSLPRKEELDAALWGKAVRWFMVGQTCEPPWSTRA